MGNPLVSRLVLSSVGGDNFKLSLHTHLFRSPGGQAEPGSQQDSFAPNQGNHIVSLVSRLQASSQVKRLSLRFRSLADCHRNTSGGFFLLLIILPSKSGSSSESPGEVLGNEDSLVSLGNSEWVWESRSEKRGLISSIALTPHGSVTSPRAPDFATTSCQTFLYLFLVSTASQYTWSGMQEDQHAVQTHLGNQVLRTQPWPNYPVDSLKIH